MANKLKTAKLLKPDEFPNKITADWLKQKMTTAEIEALHEKKRQAVGITERNEWYEAEWNKFIAQLEVGDELWEFSTPRRYWNVGFGYAGYVLLRQGKVIAKMQTKMN